MDLFYIVVASAALVYLWSIFGWWIVFAVAMLVLAKAARS